MQILKAFTEDERKAIIKAAIPCTGVEEFKLFAKVAAYFNGR